MDNVTLMFTLLQAFGYIDGALHRTLSRTTSRYQLTPFSLLQILETEITEQHGLVISDFATTEDYQAAKQLFMQQAKEKYKNIIAIDIFRSWLQRDKLVQTSNGANDSLQKLATTLLANTALHGYEVMLKKMLKLIPQQQRLEWLSKELELQQENGQTIEGAGSYQYSGNNLLHYVACSGNSMAIQVVLNFYPEQQWLTVAQAVNHRGNTALHFAAQSGNLAALETLLKLYPHRLAAITSANKNGQNVLHHAFFAKSVEAIQNVLNLFTKEEQLKLVKIADDNGATPLHFAATHADAEIIKVILDVYPPEQQFDAIKNVDNYGNTCLHKCAYFSKKSEALQVLMDVCPESRRLEIFNTINDNGNPVLHELGNSKANIELLQLLLQALPEQDRLAAITVRNRELSGHTLLHHFYDNPQARKIILTSLPESLRLAAIMATDANNRTVLHYVHDSEFTMLLTLLPEQQRAEAVSVFDENHFTPFHSVVLSRKSEIVHDILTLIPEQQRLDVINIPFGEDSNLLRLMMTQDDNMVILMLTLLPSSHRVEALRSNAVLYKAVDTNKVDFIKKTLELIPEDQRVEAINITNKGLTVLNQAIIYHYKAETFKFLLESVPEQQRLQAIATTYESRANRWTTRFDSQLSIGKILTLLPESHRLAAIKVIHQAGFRLTILAVNHVMSPVFEALPGGSLLLKLLDNLTQDQLTQLLFNDIERIKQAQQIILAESDLNNLVLLYQHFTCPNNIYSVETSEDVNGVDPKSVYTKAVQAIREHALQQLKYKLATHPQQRVELINWAKQQAIFELVAIDKLLTENTQATHGTKRSYSSFFASSSENPNAGSAADSSEAESKMAQEKRSKTNTL